MSTSQQGSQDSLETPEVVTIIRYPNRRLYDRSRGRYVTLRDIEDTVRHGRSVIVRDSKTGADLTRLLLTQIILERHPERMELFPLSLLHLILRTDGVMFAFLRDSVRQALHYVEMLQRAAPFHPLLPTQEWLRPFLPENSARPGADGDTGDLLARIAELERRLDELRRAPERPKNKSEKSSRPPEHVKE
jgi:polyhydroxyalkanoate synthesis repressor PhaR